MPRLRYRHYVLALMTSLYMLNHVDRGLMILLLQPIKEDLRLSDTQLGLVTGLAFGVFYAVLGVPIARWADRGNRVTIASLAIGVWGLTVMSYLFIANFLHLALARIAAAVGEAGGKPPTYSLVGDYFPDPGERTGAMAVYLSATSLTSLLSFSVGGWLAQTQGWRMAFFFAGIPALVMAILVRLTIREPRAARSAPDAPAAAPPPSLGEVIRTMWASPACRHLSIGLVLLFTMSQGLGPWYAAFMMRVHGVGAAELGLWFSLIFGLGALFGLFVGGFAVMRWLPRAERTQLRLTAVTVASVLPFIAIFVLNPSKLGALATLAPMSIVLSAFLPPVYALLQRLAPDAMRATVLSVVMLFANLIGMGLGPLAVGALSDALTPTLGNDGLRWAMLAVSVVTVWSGWCFWKASESVEADLAARAA